MAIIKAKDPRFNGYRANVLFKNGIGETDNEYLIMWFKSHGYTIVPPKVTEEQETMLESMSDEGLRAFLIDNGYKARLGKTTSRERMVALAKELIK